jgi:hypothetical protein
MVQLTQGVYGNERNPVIGPFGLHWGQTRRGCKLKMKNALWYNRIGEMIGAGDLSTKDFQRVAKELDDGELFFVVHDTKDGRPLVLRAYPPGPSADHARYVAENCRYVIAKDRVYWVVEKEYFVKTFGMRVRDGVVQQGLPREKIRIQLSVSLNC